MVDDGVQKQYERLPYPRMTEHDLRMEEKYYETSNKPIQFSPSVRLEKLNHYLYHGGENFR